MKKIAITGGIGSGKSTVAAIIAKETSFPVFSADRVYAELVEDPEFLQGLCRALSCNVLTPEGKLDRQKLSRLTFGNSELRQNLNAYTHPAVMDQLDRLMEESKSPVAYAEVPLLFEGGFDSRFHEVIVVFRDREARIRAVMARSGLTRAQVTERMDAQFNYDNLRRNEYTVIENNGNLDSLRSAVLAVIHEK